MEKNFGNKSEFVNRLESVVKVNGINFDKDNWYYIGIKETDVIPKGYFDNFNKDGYIVHTIDKASKNGRAIDVDLINPISGRCMTGSSSGTAINVFLGINDIGIGTDGGGSVLAPACSLNLYGFISKIICENHLEKYKKISTDGIEFTPSIGYISKSLESIKSFIELTIGLKKASKDYDIKVTKPLIEFHRETYSLIKDRIKFDEISLSYDGLNRRKMIEELSDFDFKNNILITFEGPTDLFGYGDSIIGQYGSYAKDIQKNGHKYYLKVVNMLGLSSIIVPSGKLASGILIISESSEEAIAKIICIAGQLEVERSKLEENYFSV